MSASVCALGRALGDCRLRELGCGSLLAVVEYMHPPLLFPARLRSRRQDLDPETRAWLDRIEAITPAEIQPAPRPPLRKAREESMTKPDNP